MCSQYCQGGKFPMMKLKKDVELTGSKQGNPATETKRISMGIGCNLRPGAKLKMYDDDWQGTLKCPKMASLSHSCESSMCVPLERHSRRVSPHYIYYTYYRYILCIYIVCTYSYNIGKDV